MVTMPTCEINRPVTFTSYSVLGTRRCNQ